MGEECKQGERGGWRGAQGKQVGGTGGACGVVSGGRRGSVTRVREIWPDEEFGELTGVDGNDVGRLLDELGERYDVGKM